MGGSTVEFIHLEAGQNKNKVYWHGPYPSWKTSKAGTTTFSKLRINIKVSMVKCGYI
jgi:hypothetical protein